MTRKIYVLVLTLIYYGQAMSQHNQNWAQNEIPETDRNFERTSQLYLNEFTPFQPSNHFTDSSSSMHNSGTFQNHGQSGHGGHSTSAIGNAWRHIVNSFKNPTWKDYMEHSVYWPQCADFILSFELTHKIMGDDTVRHWAVNEFCHELLFRFAVPAVTKLAAMNYEDLKF